MKKEADSQDLLSLKSCRSSVVDHVEEVSPESPRKMQDEQEVMSETSGEKWRRRVKAGTRRGHGDTGNHSFFGTGWRASPDTLIVKVAMSGCK